MKTTDLIEQDVTTPSAAMMELITHYWQVIGDAKQLIGDTSSCDEYKSYRKIDNLYLDVMKTILKEWDEHDYYYDFYLDILQNRNKDHKKLQKEFEGLLKTDLSVWGIVYYTMWTKHKDDIKKILKEKSFDANQIKILDDLSTMVMVNSNYLEKLLQLREAEATAL